jgi:hypothetical protein
VNEPWLKVVRGRPTDEELAAVLAVVAGLAASAAASEAEPRLTTTAALRRTGRALVGREGRWGLSPDWSRPRRAATIPVRTRLPAPGKTPVAGAAGA